MSLSKKEYKIFNENGFKTKDLKKSIQNVQRKLKEKCGCDSERTIMIENGDLDRIIDEEFLKEFGEELLK